MTLPSSGRQGAIAIEVSLRRHVDSWGLLGGSTTPKAKDHLRSFYSEELLASRADAPTTG